MSLVDFCKSELEISGLLDKDSVYNGMIGDAVIELIETFSKQGHSGNSAAITADLFNSIARYNPISPIVGDESEWVEVAGGLLQNRRCPALFKNAETGKSNYLDAIVYVNQKGESFTSQKIKIDIKFPFVPKTFRIDVIEDDKGKWELANPIDLEDVRDYYSKK